MPEIAYTNTLQFRFELNFFIFKVLFSILMMMYLPIFLSGQNLERTKSSVLNKDSLLSQAEKDELDTGKNATYMSEEEKDILFLINYARKYGNRFLDTYFNDFWNENIRREPNQDDLYHLAKLKKYFAKIEKDPPLPLQPDQKLCEAAQYHARDLSLTGRFDHFSQDGSDPGIRLKRFEHTGLLSENIVGGNNPLHIVMLCLIDVVDAPRYRHRKNTLKAGFLYVGIAYHPHPKYRFCSVQDFDSDQQ